MVRRRRDDDAVARAARATRPGPSGRRSAPGAREASSGPRPGRSAIGPGWLVPVAVVLLGAAALAAVAVAVELTGGGPSAEGPVAWSTLRTQDVHSLVSDPDDPRHLYFGHHDGLLETLDGGRSWLPTGLDGADAMNVARPVDDFFQIAGHDAYMETIDGGRTWQNVPNDLPGLDLHAFTVDPQDPSHAWAVAVGFGLFETADRGRTWARRQPGGWGALTAYVSAGKAVLLAVSDAGLVRSDDGGRAWTPLGRPAGQFASLAASVDGTAIYAGTTEGISRSTDGGRTWTPTALRVIAVTLNVFPQDPNIIAAVDETRRFFRSSDGGLTWPGPD